MNRLNRFLIILSLAFLQACDGINTSEDGRTKNEEAISAQESDNAWFYDTEWSGDGDFQDEGLKFYKDDTVLYFSSFANQKGVFEYNKATKTISFEGLTVLYSALSFELTSAVLDDDTSLKVYWHELGKSNEKCMLLHKRR